MGVKMDVTITEEMSGVFENRVVTEIFGLKWEEVIQDSRKLHNEELHNLDNSMIKSRRMRSAGYVALTEERLSTCMHAPNI
jgi:hypothetical protein